MSELRKTPLHAVHLESGAKMVPFGGWDMPVEYSGLIAEHQAVRTAAGLFDVSHMGEFEVAGPGALAFLQRVTANNVAKLVDGQAQYSALPMPTGCPVDDIIVYRRGAERYLVVVNAANIAKDWAWLQAQSPLGLHARGPERRFRARGAPGTEGRGDPAAAHAARPRGRSASTASPKAPWPATRRSWRAPATRARTASSCSWRPAHAACGLAPADRGRAARRASCPPGLGARDTLRLEARMMLYGNDMDETTTLIEAGLGWIVSFDEAKGDFTGRQVLLEQKTSGAPRKLVGFETTERGIPRHGYPVFLGDEADRDASPRAATPPSCRRASGSPTCRPRAPAWAPSSRSEIRGRRIGARVVPTPFYKRPR